jgi:lysozyme family protein
MADFSKAFSASYAARGGYAAISEGGETYRGIHRRFHPAWSGWRIIDALKFAASDEDELQSTLSQNKRLREKVWNWFKQMYWDRFSGDLIPNQEIAAELLESSVELGVGRAVNCLQKSVNLLNAGRREQASIVEDGRLGQETMDALEDCLKIDGASYLLNVMRILQALYYIGRMKKNPGQDLFARDRLGQFAVTRQKAWIKPAPPKDLRVED